MGLVKYTYLKLLLKKLQAAFFMCQGRQRLEGKEVYESSAIYSNKSMLVAEKDWRLPKNLLHVVVSSKRKWH